MEIKNEVTIATHNGSQVARQHNLRNPKVIAKEDHIDPNGHFEVWLDEDPKATYERLFGAAVQAYNAKQTRPDRQITDYYKQICEDSKKKPVYELIIGIYGKKADGTPICSKNDGRRILRAFTDNTEEETRQRGRVLCRLSFYACKHRLSLEGKKCDYRQNWNNKDIDGPVVEILTKLISDPKLADYIRAKLSSVVDAETVEADIAKIGKALKRTQANKKARYKDLEELIPTDPVDSVKIQDTKASIDNLSVKEVEYRQDLAELHNKLVAVKQNQLTKETVLKVLSHFSLFFDKMTPADKPLLLRSLVTEIQIFPEKTKDGRIVKSIKLCVPVVYKNDKTPKISWDKLTPVESVVCLSRKEI